MDKTKIVALGFLALLVGGLMWSGTQKPPLATSPAASVPHDHNGDGVPDHGDEAHSEGGAGQTASVPHDHDGDGKSDHTEAEHAALANFDFAGKVKTLQKQDLKTGTGKAAKPGDTLVMNYKGQLLNGQVFDQSYGRAPFSFRLGAGEVIVGWDEGIVGMKEGGKRKLTIPADKAYGPSGQGPIPPNATLIFEVELIKVGA